MLFPLDSNRDAAIVVFDDAKDRESTLLHRHVFETVSLQVQRLPPVFRTVEVEIDPVFATLLPGVVHKLMSSYGPSMNTSLGRQNTHKLSFSCPNELRYVEEEVYNHIARQSEAPHFSSIATGLSYSEQVELAQGGGINFEDEAVLGKKGNIYQPQDSDPEVFIGQLTTESDNPFAAHAAGDKKIEENETSTTDVQMTGPLEQTSGFDDGGSLTKTDHTVILDMFSFNFLRKFEKAAIEKILKNYNVKLVQEEDGFSVQVTFLPCKGKQSTREMLTAVEKFTTLYQTTHARLTRKTVDCPSVSVDKLEMAASKTSEFFQNSALITRLPGNPVRYVFLSNVDVEKVVKYFRNSADIKSSRKLKTSSLAPKDAQGASAQSAGSQFGNTNCSDQVECEPCFHSTTRFSSSLNVTSSPTQSLGVLADVHFITDEGINNCIRKGDITMQKVEAIVSPCQQNLKKTGGAAMAIEKAAGLHLERWCFDFMKKHNIHQVDVMQCLISPGFNLCSTIIHAIGPRLGYNKQEFLKELYHTFLNCLLKADHHKVTSLAMPLIGSGMIAGPKKDCADALVRAIFDFSRQGNKTKCLRDIYLVNVDSEACEAIKLSFETMFQTPVTHQTVPAATKAGDDVLDAAQGMSRGSDRLSDKDTQNDLKQMAAASCKDGSNQNKSDRKSDTKTSTMSPKTSSTDGKTADDSCPICLGDLKKDTSVQALSCKHRFCKTCITLHFKNSYKCPVCRAVCHQPKGNQPEGTMKEYTRQFVDLPGFKGDGTITINYDIPSGIQVEGHPNPGKSFYGATRTAYLPNNQEGREVLSLLRKAFNARLVFTVGRSVTSGAENTVTWTSIHHKTSQTGGPHNYGYPDPGYLTRVKEDLAALGIK